jgi:hypothetical protein
MADQNRAKKCFQMGRIGCILLVAQKAIIAIFQLLAYFFNLCTKYEKLCQMTFTGIP